MCSSDLIFYSGSAGLAIEPIFLAPSRFHIIAAPKFKTIEPRPARSQQHFSRRQQMLLKVLHIRKCNKSSLESRVSQSAKSLQEGKAYKEHKVIKSCVLGS